MASKRERENAAANTVVQHLMALTGAAAHGRLHDDNSRDRMHDFTITTKADTIALEVTTIADGNRVGRDIRWNQAAPGGWVDVSGLTGCWFALHEGAIEAGSAIAALKAHLTTLEKLGIEWMKTSQWQEHAWAPASLRPPEWETARVLHAAGFSVLSRVAATEALLAERGGQVQVGRAYGFSRPVDRNLPATLVSEELRQNHLSDVRKLLAADDVTSRHLWLWVELPEGVAMLRSFATEGLPEVGVDVDGIDGVWLGHSPAASSVAGYVWLRQHGWSEFSGTRDESDLGTH